MALLQVYDHTWAARQQAAALATAEWHRRLAPDIFTEIPERLIRIRNFDIPLQPAPWWASQRRRFSYHFRGGWSGRMSKWLTSARPG